MVKIVYPGAKNSAVRRCPLLAQNLVYGVISTRGVFGRNFGIFETFFSFWVGYGRSALYGEGMHLQRDCHVVQYEAQNGGSLLSNCPFPREFDPGLW